MKLNFTELRLFLNRFILLRKIKNTFFPWPIKLKRKRLIFNTSNILKSDATVWSDETFYKTEYYTDLDQTSIRLLQEVKDNSHTDDNILNICCNIGRHINYLVNCGYKNVYGFDIMKPAIDKMDKVFPNINMKKIENCNINSYFDSKENGFFDYAYTHTATLELIHPSFDIGKMLMKKVKKGFTFYLNEDGHTYPRFWRYIFRKNGFRMKKAEKINNATLLTFLRQ
ncbi:MAG: hypothetical protein CMG74_09560 [Candidatus Marinimicrobia bacterium]|nr:hypothetical protein [Candidatus Neomarinimicrobiota bacterium]|tara:strand:+ start:521 stop:1198 length:678 start_codon:yes stop_codon:yes gene_type:complete